MAVDSLVPDDVEPGGDGVVLTRLALKLQNRIPKLCVLKTFYDGCETVPTMYVSSSVNTTSTAVYKRFVEICPLNLASTIANSVSTNQQPTGFRLVKDQSMRSTDADDMWYESRMYLKSRQLFHDVSVYGSGYAYVTGFQYPSWIQMLSPWNTMVSDDGDSAVVYTYSPDEGMERLTLFRLVRDEQQTPVIVYSRAAVRETDSSTMPSESDDDKIYELANSYDARMPSFDPTFEWEGAASSDGLDFAVQCGSLPIVKVSSANGKGQFESSLATLKAIDQQRFQRFCIQEMQAFKQRAISGDLPETYAEDDPMVLANKAQAGDRIDYTELFEAGPAALWMLPQNAEIWESGTTDITPIVTAASTDIKQLAAATGTPLSILSPDVSGSAEGAKLTTRTLALKVKDLNIRANDAFVLLLRMALVASGKGAASDERFETVWEPVDLPSDLDQAQAASYVKGILPVKTIMRRILHMTEADIAEAMRDVQDESFIAALGAENYALANTTETQSASELTEPLSEAGMLEPSSTENTDTGQTVEVLS